MKVFFDTSALIKAYLTEEGSDKVNDILDDASIVYVSDIALIECFSVLNRLYFEKKYIKKITL